MPSIEELGKRVKAKYPGTYDDLPDAELGVRVRGKFPGAYDDFTNDTPIAAPAVPSITPKAAPVAPPMMSSTVDPFAPKQDWLPSKPKPAPQLKPSTLAAPEDAVIPQAPGKIPQTVEMSPVGQTNAPVPGRIPGMELLGGVAPGVPTKPRPIGEVDAPSLAGDMAGGFVRGAGSAAMSVPRVLSRIPGGFRDDLEALRPTPPNQEFIGAEARAAEDARNRQQMAGMISRAEDSALPAAPLTVPGKFAEALGSTAPYMAAGAVGGNAATGALGVAAGVDEAMTRADMSGKPITDEQRALIGAGGAAIGSTEALPFARLLGKLKGAGVVAEAADDAGIVKQLFPGVKEYLTSAGKQGLEEGAQEGFSNLAQDAMEASYGARPTDKIGQDFFENAGTGGAVGVFIDALTTLAGSRAGRARMRQSGVDPDAFRAWAEQQNQEKQRAVADVLGVPVEAAQPAPAPAPPQVQPEAAPAVAPQPDPLQQAIKAAPPLPQKAKPVGKAAVEPGDDGVSYKIEALPNGEFRARLVDSEGNPFGPYWTMPDRESAELKGVALLNKHRYGIDDAPTPVFTAKKELSEKELDEITADSLSNQNLPSIKIDELKNGKFKVYLADGSGDSIGTSWTYADRQAAEKKGNEMLQEHISSNPPTETNTIPAPGPREDVVQPKPAEAAAPVAVESDAEIEAEVRQRLRGRPEKEILEAIEYDKFLRNQRVRIEKNAEAAEKEWSFTNGMGDLPVIKADQLKKNWVHGTSPESKKSILESGKFDPSKGKRFYDYSEFGVDASYFTDADSWWMKDPESGRAIKYHDSIGAEVSPDANIALIRTPKDADVLAQRLGFENWDKLDRVLNVDGLKDTTGNRSEAEKSAALSQRIREMGIDGFYVYPSRIEAGRGPAPDQLVILNHDVIRPKEPNAPLSPEAPPPPGPVEAAAPAPIQEVNPPKPGELIGEDGIGARRDSLFPTEEMAESFISDERLGTSLRDHHEFEIRPEEGGWRIYRRSMSTGKYHPWTYFVDGKPVWKNPKPYSTKATRLEERTRTTDEPIAPTPVESPAPAPVQRDTAPESPGRVGETWQDPKKLRIRTEDLTVDPIRFQYKVDNIGQGGVTEHLKDVVKWNDSLAGTIFVWKDPADGKTYVVNGHHRYELAKRIGQPDLSVSYIDAKTAKEARATGALQNIGEGNGTAIDAAKFMRDTGMTAEDLAANQISIRGPIAKQATALASLAPSLFDDVVHGNMDPKRAAIIGEGLKNFDDQKAVLRIIEKQEAKGKNPSDAEVKEMIRLANGGERVETKDDSQGNLFGESDSADDSRSLIYELSQISSYIRTRLSQEKKLFGLVGSKSAADRLGAAGNEIKAEANQKIADQAKQVLAAYDKLSESAGPITDALVQGARRVASGEKLDAVKEDVYSSIRDSVARLLPGLQEESEKGKSESADLRADDQAGDQQRADGVQEKPRRGLSGTVEKVGGVKQETLVNDGEARESQIAAKNDRNRPIAEVPLSLTADEAPAPTGPDERQSSMFGGDEEGSGEVVGYAPGKSAAFRPGTPTPAKGKAAKPAGGRKGQMTSRSEIVKNLSSFLNNIPIRTGGFAGKGRGVLGIFKPRESVIRSAKALDLPTISHEIGHAIHKYLWGAEPIKDKKGNPTGRVRLSNKPFRPFKAELGALDYDQNQKRPFEGFAEYIRLRITDPAEATIRAPHFQAWLNQHLAQHPDLAAVLDQAQQQYRNWDIQPGAVKIAASINVKPTEKSFWDKFTEAKVALSYDWVDDKVDIKNAVDLFQKLGSTVTDVNNAYRLARMINGSFTRASMSLDGGRVNAKYEVDGPGLAQILKPIKARPESEQNPKFKTLVKDWNLQMANDGMDDLRLYLVGKRLQNYLDNGLETGFDKDMIRDAIRYSETPALKAAAEAIHDYNDGILQYVVDKGAMSKEAAEMIRSKNEFYVPLYRVMDNESTKSLLGRKMLDLNSPVMRRKGSTREMIDPLESIVRNTYSMMSYADRNEVAQALVKQAAKVQDQGWLIESGIVRPMKRTEFNLKEVEKQIKELLDDNGIDASGVDFDSMAAIYRLNTAPKRSDGIVSVVVDGTPQLFQMDKNLIRGLDSMTQGQANLFFRFMSNATGLLRFGATAGNPEFISTNWFRDQFMAGLQSRNGYIPFLDGVAGAFTLLRNPEMVAEWRRNGGATAAMMPLTRDNLRKSIDRMTMDRKELLIRHPLEIITLLKDVLTVMGSMSEEATRIGEYRLARKRGKSAAEAAFDSRDVTLDFERMGHLARFANRIIPFFSVSINAAQRFAEMHDPRNPKQAARAAALGFLGITLPSLMLWWMNKDDEDYKKIEDWKRDLFWLIPTKGTGLERTFGPFIRLPKPPLFGQMYGSAAERMADSLYAKNKHAFDGFGKTLFDMWTPPMSAQTFKPLQEVWSNYNEFTDRPIETDAMRKRSPKNRYTQSTSETAKAISRAFGTFMESGPSPAQIEHLMLGYTAGLGRFTTTIAEEVSGARDDRPAMGPADRPILRAFSTPRTPFFSTNYKLYSKELRTLSQKQEDFKFTKDPADKLSANDSERLKQLKKLEKQLADIRSQQYRIAQDKTLGRQQKTDKIDALYEKRETLLLRNKRLFDK